MLFRSSETNGIDLLRTLLAQRPTLNLLVNTSSDPKKLSGLKSAIIEHQAGFVFIHKGTQIDSDLTLEKIKTAISGDTDRRDIKSTLGDFPMKPKWLEAVRLASEGHDNAEISQKMRPSEKPHKNHARTVNNYLSNAGTVLGIYTEDGGDFRTRVIIAARDARLIE